MKKIHGTVGEFRRPDAVLEAAILARSAGYEQLEAFTPFAVEGLAEETGLRKTAVPLITLIGGLIGGCGGYWMMWYSATLNYPLNIGGRPLHSWPSFIPITFELAVLCASLAATFGMLALNGLPRPHHPIFNTPHFVERNSSHGYLCVLATNVNYASGEVAKFLHESGAQNVWEIPA
jgi:hypothetical protein